MANKFHTCSLISIFAQVHAPVENGFDFIRRYSGELCEAFFDNLSGRTHQRVLPLFVYCEDRRSTCGGIMDQRQRK